MLNFEPGSFGSSTKGIHGDPMGEEAPEYIYEQRVLEVLKEIRKQGLISLKHYNAFKSVWDEVAWKDRHLADLVTRTLYAMYPQTLGSVEEIAKSINSVVSSAGSYWNIRSCLPEWAEMISNTFSEGQLDSWEQTVSRLGIPGNKERPGDRPKPEKFGKLWI